MPQENYTGAAQALKAILERPDAVQLFRAYLTALPPSTIREIGDPHQCYLCGWLKRETGLQAVVTMTTVMLPFDNTTVLELPEALAAWQHRLMGRYRRTGVPPTFLVAVQDAVLELRG